MDRKFLAETILKVLVRHLSFDLLLNKMSNPNSDCCNTAHKTVAYLATYKIKCPCCTKYVPGMKFTVHLEKCIKKLKQQDDENFSMPSTLNI
ncbi:hypothetical protein GVAV_003063 [Gurleya vavrai]